MCVSVCVGGVFPLITSDDNRQATLEWLQSALTYRRCEGGRQSKSPGRTQMDNDNKKYQKGKPTKYLRRQRCAERVNEENLNENDKCE